MTDEPERPSGLPTRSPATGAARRAHRRARRWRLRPKLDLDRGLDDSYGASRDRLQSPSAERGGRTVLDTPPATFLSEPCAGRLLRPGLYDADRDPAQKRAGSPRGTFTCPVSNPSRCLREIGRPSINHAAPQHTASTCVAGATCLETATKGSFLCRAWRETGEPCTGPNDACAPGTTCTGGKCTTTGMNAGVYEQVCGP
jgi:hypothetical protein